MPVRRSGKWVLVPTAVPDTVPHEQVMKQSLLGVRLLTFFNGLKIK